MLLGGLMAVCLVLTFFPQKYRAASSLTPTDPASLGLSGTLGQLGAVGGVFGNQAALEVTVKIARSQYVRSIVAQQLKLPQRLDKTPLQTDRWLNSHVDVTILRGGIIEFEMKLYDAELAKQIVGAYGEAVREQLASVSHDQTAYKRQILVKLVEQASARLTRAQAAYDSFRLTTHYSSPQEAIGSIGQWETTLQGEIRAKQIELNAARRFGTDQNVRVQQLQSELDTLEGQLAETRSTKPVDSSSVGKVVNQSTELDRLWRELNLSLSLYDNYKRFLQGTSVEDLTSTANVRILEPAYVDTERQLNVMPMGLGLLLLLLALTMEFYAIRPPLGSGEVA